MHIQRNIPSVEEVKNMTAKGKAKSSVKIAKNIKANGKTYKVTAIAANALKGNKKVTSVSIGSNVEKIGKKAFANCTKLKTVTVNGNKLKTIGQNTENCWKISLQGCFKEDNG